MVVTAPKRVGIIWVVTATEGNGESVDYGYPTEFAAQEAYKFLAAKEGEHHDD